MIPVSERTSALYASIGTEALQSAYQLETVEPHEEAHASFVLRKPMRMNPDGSLKQSSGPSSDNFAERTLRSDGSEQVDVYINSPWGTFVSFFHVLMLAAETDVVHVYLASGIYSDDAALFLGSMDICRAPITVHVGYVEGFYGACIIAKADHVITTNSSAVSLSTPLEYFTLRGLGYEQQQLGYARRSVGRFTEDLIRSGLCTEEEIGDLLTKNKHILLKRGDLADRLGKTPAVSAEL